MVNEKQAKQMVAEIAGLKRWKDEKAGFGSLICEEEDKGEYFFQVPSNITVYDLQSENLKKLPVQGTIEPDGTIEMVHEWIATKNYEKEQYEDEVSPRYLKYPIFDEDYATSNFIYETFFPPKSVSKARKYLGWE